MLGAIAVLVLSAKLVSPVQNSTAEADPKLLCMNDYLSTIYCSLKAPEDRPPHNGSDWLAFAGLYMEDHELVMKTEKCMLWYADGVFSCAVSIDRPDAFPDGITFQIQHCHLGEPCVILEEEYYPKYNIQPIPPTQLVVQLNSSELHFSWDSGYEEHPASSAQPKPYFVRALQYELCMDREGHDENPITVFQKERSFKANVERFAVNAEYRARVRTHRPDLRDYHGEWSKWSQETRFITSGLQADVITEKETPSVGLDTGLIIALSFLVPVLLLLCSIPVLKLRKGTFIPRPVLRVSPLTNSYAGHIKSIEATPSIDKVLSETENTARVCVLTESADVPAESGDTRLPLDAGTEPAVPCGGGQTPALGVSSLGHPYAVTDEKSCWDPESSAGTDSGCWHCSGTSMDGERDHRWYRNAYCTLADRQSDLDGHSSTAGAPQTDPENRADYQNQGTAV